MIMYYTKKDHLIDFVDMLINDESVKLMNKDVQFIFTLDLIMLFVEDLLLDLTISDLSSGWIY